MLRRLRAEALPDARRDPVDPETLTAAAAIVRDVAAGGEAALRAHATRLGDLAPGAPLVLGPDALQAARDALPDAQVALLERTAERIRAFALAQRACLAPLDTAVPGGRAGHTVAPVQRAGCYAPGGRYPLPSSVLMTAVTARAAGVPEVWVMSPRPTPVTLAAAAVAGADGLVTVGGAHGIAAFAHGAGPVPAVDVIVGPGNRWVTAAKQLVTGRVGIDMLAGPSELVVLADGGADPDVVAADLLAQAEHDPDARPILVTTSPDLADAVDRALGAQLATLPTADTARLAVAEGFCVVCDDLPAARAVCDRLAPEHLEVLTADPDDDARHLQHYGGLFVGAGAAEVLGDYGVGPNHVLPTGSTARFTGGLSVLHFLRVRTWLRMDAPADVAADAAALARLEGLEAHARSAERRR
ncbi:MAG: histidinol dehydrogenase [Alphaproteobacteria bacterium]|nr:histidinol dehydrogenase [Alphaproteobacteria bacterium]